MARVVRRRKNPLLPVLLIFVFLFLIAAVMATLAYNNGQEDKKSLALEIARRKKIITTKELGSNAIVKQIISEKDKSREAPTVVAELQGRIAELTRRITGSDIAAAAAIEQINEAIGQTAFILNELKIARDAVEAEKAKVKKLDADYTALASRQQNAAEAYKTLDEQFKAKASELAAEVRKLDAEKTTLATEHAAAIKANDTTWQEKVSKQEQEVDARIAEVSKLTVEIDKSKIIIAGLRAQLRSKKKTREQDIAVREAGKIKELMPNRDVCFIPLGTKDRVVRGMTFRVYGAEGIPNDGEGHKASLTVIRTFETISQCRVTPVKEDDPVAIGDPFANIAFDPTRPPLFVVEGKFDLTGMGRLTETGAQEVVSLIKRAGGKVTDKLSVEVDFLVLGPEPSKPGELEEDAPGPTKKAHEIRMQEYEQWLKMRDRAIALNVPKLNTRRFLILTGYDSTPEYKN